MPNYHIEFDLCDDDETDDPLDDAAMEEFVVDSLEGNVSVQVTNVKITKLEKEKENKKCQK